MRMISHWRPVLLITLLLTGACATDSQTTAPASETAMPPAAAPIPASASAAVTGLKATLADDVRPYTKDGVAYLKWQTFWIVHWDPVPGAKNYEITLFTSEGMSRKTKTVDGPPYRLEVAVGDNPKTQGLLAREASLQAIQGLLSIRVAPRFADATTGPPSPWLTVGRAYPAQ